MKPNNLRWTAAGLSALIMSLQPACKKDRAEKEPPKNLPTEPATKDTAPVNHHASALADAAAAARIIRERPIDAWYGLYMGGKKLGYAHIWTRTSNKGEPGGYVISLSATLMTSGFGSDKIEIAETRYYHANPPHGLIELRSKEKSNKGGREMSFVAKGDGLVVNQTADGAKKPERTIAASKETLASSLAYMGVDTARLKKGMKASYYSFESEEEKDEKNELEVASVQTRVLGGVSTKVGILLSRTEGEDTVNTVTVAGRGTVLKATFGPGLFMKLEDQAVAKKDVVGFGVISDAVKVNRKLGDPSEVKSLRLIVGVAKGFKLHNVPNQQVKARPDGRFDVQLRVGPAEAVTPKERAAALRVTGSIDHTSPSIKELAAKLTEGATTDREKADKINAWIYKTLKKDLSTNLSTASQVLAKKIGDCTEHTILLLALLRASGIPARELSGLIYMGDEFQAFGYHAWAEVAIDGRWVPIDPSWGENVASAAHLRLGAGTKDEWVATMGSITIEAPK